MSKPTADPIVQEFARCLAQALDLDRLILFGSRARGDHLLTSDYDFIVVSEAFVGQPFPTRGMELYDCWPSDLPFEALCYTPEEFERKRQQLCIVQEALHQGIQVGLNELD